MDLEEKRIIEVRTQKGVPQRNKNDRNTVPGSVLLFRRTIFAILFCHGKMWLLWLRGSESMFPVKLRSSLAFFKTHCWPSTCLLSHQTSQRFIFSCFYRLCNLNVFGFRIVDSKGGSILTPGWWEFWRRAAHDLVKVILECCIGGP